MQQRTPLSVVMEQQRVSQNELRARTGLARQTITEAYHGRTVSPLTYVKIARALGVPVAVISPLAAAELDGLRVR